MKYLLIGGTFNPIHYGHLFLADEVKNALGYDTVLFIPAYSPVHKRSEKLVDARHRLAMLEIAVRNYREFSIETCELERKGASYSIDTIHFLTRKYGWKEKPGFVIGDDLIKDFHKWKKPEELSRIVDLIVVHRKFSERLEFDLPHLYVDNLIMPISSSIIRERLQAKKNVRFLLPDNVLGYIEKYGLYH